VIPGKQYTPEVILHIAWRRKWLVVLVAIPVATLIALWTYQLANVYQSETLILVVPQRVPEAFVRSTVTTRIEDRLQSISQQIMSRTRLERIIYDFNLYADRRETMLMEDVVELMRKNINVQVVKGDAFRVAFIGNHPQTVMRVTERLASLFIDENLKDRELVAEGTDRFLESQLEEAKTRLIDNEQKLEAFRKRHDGELPTQVESNMQGLHNTEMQLQSVTDSINRDRDRRLFLERAIRDANSPDLVGAVPTVSPGSSGPAPVSAAEQLRQAEAELRDLVSRLKPEHPDVGRAKRAIAELRARVQAEAAERSAHPAVGVAVSPMEAARQRRVEELQADLASIDKQIVARTAEERRLRGVMADYQRRIEAAPTRETELAELTRDYDTLQANYKSLLVKKQESRIATDLEHKQIGQQFKVLDPPRLPEKPSSPNRLVRYAAGVIGGLGLGLLLVALLEYLDRTMRSESDVQAALGLPVIVTIPLIKSRAGG
jgi:polysaccharide chain length determinant protein (PEP-CTERM system associated)